MHKHAEFYTNACLYIILYVHACGIHQFTECLKLKMFALLAIYFENEKLFKYVSLHCTDQHSVSTVNHVFLACIQYSMRLFVRLIQMLWNN